MHVSRLIPSGDVIEYDAIARVDSSGQVALERTRAPYSFELACARALFLSAEDLPLPNFPDWFLISNHPVIINRYTTGRTYTRMAMDAMGYVPEFSIDTLPGW